MSVDTGSFKDLSDDAQCLFIHLYQRKGNPVTSVHSDAVISLKILYSDSVV